MARPARLSQVRPVRPGSVAATAARTGKEVRAGLAGIMDIQIVVITPVPVTGGAGAANRVLLRLALAAGADLAGGTPALDGAYCAGIRPAGPAAPLSRNLLGHITRR